MRIKEWVPGRKNEKEKVPLYELTSAGQFLAWTIKATDPEKIDDPMWPIRPKPRDRIVRGDSAVDQGRSKSVTKVFEIVTEYTKLKESFVLRFISAFLEKCFLRGVFGEIIDFYFYYDLKFIEVNKGQEIMRLFIKLNHVLHWLFVQPVLFVETLNEMDDETKRVLMFNFRIDIEEYHDRYYLASYIRRYSYSAYRDPALYYSEDMTISGKEWQLLRMKNIGNEEVVMIPALCSNCKSEVPLRMNITKYFDHILEFISGSISLENIIANCGECKKRGTVSGKIYMPLDMYTGHERI